MGRAFDKGKGEGKRVLGSLALGTLYGRAELCLLSKVRGGPASY
jgi:hypothetical protein